MSGLLNLLNPEPDSSGSQGPSNSQKRMPYATQGTNYSFSPSPADVRLRVRAIVEEDDQMDPQSDTQMDGAMNGYSGQRVTSGGRARSPSKKARLLSVSPVRGTPTMRPSLPTSEDLVDDDAPMEAYESAEEGDDGEGGDDDEGGDDGDGGEEGEGDDEGDGDEEEVGGEVGEEGEDDDEEDDEEEDDESDGDDKSEDLEGGDENEDFEVTGENIQHPSNSPQIKIKAEPGSTDPDTGTSSALAPDGSSNTEVVNQLPVKKKRKAVRAASEEMPKPPPPLKTIRIDLNIEKQPGKPYVVYDFTAEAKKAGYIAEEDYIASDPVYIPPLDEQELALIAAERSRSRGRGNVLDDREPEAGPSAGPSVGEVGGAVAVPMSQPEAAPSGSILANLADLSPEELARQFDARDAAMNKKKRQRKKEEEYEQDSLIDDSELYQDVPMQLGRPRKTGFYVQLGPLDVVYPENGKKRTRAKGPQKKKLAPTPAAELDIPSLGEMVEARRAAMAGYGEGSSSSPIKIDDDDDDDRPGPSQRREAPPSPSPPPPEPYDPTSYPSAKNLDAKCYPPWPSYPRPIRHRLTILKNKSDAHKWPANRNKFPEHLKPPLKEVGLAMIRLGIFGNKESAAEVWGCLPCCLPYNVRTLQKLVTKMCYEPYTEYLNQCEEAGIDAFVAAANEEEPAWLAKNEAAKEVYEQAMVKWREDHPTTNSSTFSPTQAAADDSAPSAPGAASKPIFAKPRYVWSAKMREIFHMLLDNTQEMVNYSIHCVDDLGIFYIEVLKESFLRPKLYRKIVDRCNREYINNDQCSKEMTRWKTKRGLPPGNAKDAKEKEIKESKEKEKEKDKAK